MAWRRFLASRLTEPFFFAILLELRYNSEHSLGAHRYRLSMSIVDCRLLASFLPLLASV